MQFPPALRSEGEVGGAEGPVLLSAFRASTQCLATAPALRVHRPRVSFRGSSDRNRGRGILYPQHQNATLRTELVLAHCMLVLVCLVRGGPRLRRMGISSGISITVPVTCTGLRACHHQGKYDTNGAMPWFRGLVWHP